MPAAVVPNGIADPVVLYRSGITAVDFLPAPSAPVGVDVPGGGSLVFATTYNFAVCLETPAGIGLSSPSAAVVTAADASSTHAIDVAVVQAPGAIFYDLFLSTDAQPKWVGVVTEAQRAAGVTISAVGVVTPGGPAPGSVRVQIVGTGVARNSSPFNIGSSAVPSLASPLACSGRSKARVWMGLSWTDLRVAPNALVVLYGRRRGSLLWSYVGIVQLSTSTPYSSNASFDISGCDELLCLVSTIAGNGASISIEVSLA